MNLCVLINWLLGLLDYHSGKTSCKEPGWCEYWQNKEGWVKYMPTCPYFKIETLKNTFETLI